VDQRNDDSFRHLHPASIALSILLRAAVT
jgi:hypothetical protein